jgi:hypothetical protein
MRYRNLLDQPAAFWSEPEIIGLVRNSVEASGAGEDVLLPSMEELLAGSRASR